MTYYRLGRQEKEGWEIISYDTGTDPAYGAVVGHIYLESSAIELIERANLGSIVLPIKEYWNEFMKYTPVTLKDL